MIEEKAKKGKGTVSGSRIVVGLSPVQGFVQLKACIRVA